MRTMAVVAVAVVALTGALEAQGNRHAGFWFGFGLGGGINLSDGLDDAQLGGGAGYIRLGGTPSQRVLLGFEGIGWGRDKDGSTLARGVGTFTVMFYPSQRGGLFLKGGVGGASLTISTEDGNTTTTTTENGFGTSAGLGFDVKLGRNIYLTPNADILLQLFDSKVDPVFGEIPSSNAILVFTLGLTWH